MDAGFYLNPETNLPHVFDHGVTEEEAEYVLEAPAEDRPRASRRARGGRENFRRALVESSLSIGDRWHGLDHHQLSVAAESAPSTPAPNEKAMTAKKLSSREMTPPGDIAREYDAMSDDEWVMDEESWAAGGATAMLIPNEMVNPVRELLSAANNAALRPRTRATANLVVPQSPFADSGRRRSAASGR